MIAFSIWSSDHPRPRKEPLGPSVDRVAPDIMGRFARTGRLQGLGWAATLVMAVAAIAMLVTSYSVQARAGRTMPPTESDGPLRRPESRASYRF